MAPATIRWGMIGCGEVTEVKSGPAFARPPHSSLVAVTSRSRARAQDYAHRHNVPRVHDDAAALVGDPDVDAIYIATPPSSHKTYAVLAAEAGKPVYVEKPMATSHADCLEMINAAERARVPLFVAYYRRALPRFQEIARLLSAGAIGDIRAVTVSLRQPPAPAHADHANLPWRVIPAIAGGGLFMDLASHTLDLLDFFLGPINDAHGVTANQAGLYDAEDIVVGQFRFKSGALGTGSWCFAAGDRADRTEIIGSRGLIAFSTFADIPHEITIDGQTTTSFIPNPPHVQEPLITSIVGALTGRGSCPSTGTSAARTAWVMDRIRAH